jgi:hypothetical protein
MGFRGKPAQAPANYATDAATVTGSGDFPFRLAQVPVDGSETVYVGGLMQPRAKWQRQDDVLALLSEGVLVGGEPVEVTYRWYEGATRAVVYDLVESFEGGVAGQPIAVGGDIAQLYGAPTYAAGGLFGSLCAACPSTNAPLFAVPAQDFYGSVYYNPTKGSGAYGRVVRFGNDTTAGHLNIELGSIKLDAGGGVYLADGSDTSRASSAQSVWTAGQWSRVDWHATAAAGSFTLVARFFTQPDSVDYDLELSGSWPAVTPAVYFGVGGGDIGWTVDCDMVRAETAAWPLPYPVA